EFGRLQPAGDEVVEQRPPGGLALAAHVLHGEQHLLAVAAHVEDARSEIDAAFLSSRTRTTVPSRISRTMSSASSGRFDQASQSVFTFRQMRLTASLPIAPLEQRALEQRRQRPAH